MAHTDELRVFADEHGLALITAVDLIEWRRKHEKLILSGSSRRIPTRHGEFRAIGYTIYEDVEHVALVRGDRRGPNADAVTTCWSGYSSADWRCLGHTAAIAGSADAALAMVAREARRGAVHACTRGPRHRPDATGRPTNCRTPARHR